ncbi:hypothetical protein C0585_05745 [Candidatus Woesearchaeota archaeon]|nr:MAG: hypothetical protein C0585_05745 [Candidatus Woesearchaeota archaeon]
MKKIIFIFTILFLPVVFGISQDPGCYAGSDYYVFKYQDFAPEFTALYDDTDLYFDIDNDGVWEYKSNIDAFETYNAELNWKLKDNSYVHSSKPIVYNQRTFELDGSLGTSYGYACIPPIDSLKYELILPELKSTDFTWNIISKNASLNILGSDGSLKKVDIEDSYDLYVRADHTTSDVWYINSTKPLFAISNSGSVSHLGTDFFKVAPGITYIGVIEDETNIKVDENGDGIFESGEYLDTGLHRFSFTAGSRIKSNKKIGVFESQEPVPDYYTRDITSAILADSINDELFVKIHEKNRVFITGVFNDDEGFLVTDFEYENENYTGDEGVVSNSVERLGFEGSGFVKAKRPVTTFFNYNSGRYAYQRPFQTIEPYISSFSKLKFLGLEDDAIINVRAFNPTIRTLEDIEVTINFIDYFTDENIEYRMSIKNLEDDSIIEGPITSSVTPIDLGGIREFNIDIDRLEPNQYVDIDYTIITPPIEGIYSFPPANMKFKSEIWYVN